MFVVLPFVALSAGGFRKHPSSSTFKAPEIMFRSASAISKNKSFGIVSKETQEVGMLVLRCIRSSSNSCLLCLERA